MNAGEATKYAAAGASALMAGAALYQQWATRRAARDTTEGDRARLSADTRNRDLDRLYLGLRTMISDLQAEQKGLRATIDEHEATIEKLRLANADLYGDKQQLANQLRNQEQTIAQLKARVAELEAKAG